MNVISSKGSAIKTTVFGDKICFTYNPPGKTDLEANVFQTQVGSDPLQTDSIHDHVYPIQLFIALNSSEVNMLWGIFIHNEKMATMDGTGNMMSNI